MNNYRYPGTPPFDTNESNIFFGRKNETQEFFNRIREQRMSVLYAPSGIGKSSLLNAGIFPLLRQNNFWPVQIKFEKINENKLISNYNGKEEIIPLSDPISVFCYWLKIAYEKAYNNTNENLNKGDISPYKINSFRLWEEVKIRQFPNNCSPVFVFDQFEDFFNYPEKQKTAFLQQFSELMHEQAPTRIAAAIAINESPSEEEILWARQPDIRAVFAIRYDKLGDLDSCKSYLPLLTRNRYLLKPLKAGSSYSTAEEAIQEPASITGDFLTPPYTYDPEVLKRIIDELKDDNDEVDATQLQIVCQTLEEQLKARLSTNNKALIIDQELVPNDDTIKTIIRNFYQRKLNGLTMSTDIDLASRALENFFVMKGRRIGIDELPLQEFLGDRSEDIINYLIKARLIRAQPTPRGITSYELSHEKLVKPVEDAKKERMAEEEKQIILQRVERDKLLELAALENRKQKEIQQKEEERKRILAEQHRLEKEADTEKKLREKERLRNSKLRVAVVIMVILSIGLALLAYDLYRERQYSNKIRIVALNASTEQLYRGGKHALAFRVSERNNNKDSFLIKKLLAAFSGESVVTDDSNKYVISFFKDNTLRISKLYKDSLYNNSQQELLVKPPKSFRIFQNNFFLIEKDTKLKIFNLKTEDNKIIWEQSLAKGARFSGLLPSIKISNFGNFFIVRDNINDFHLYNINGNKVVEFSKFHNITSQNSFNKNILVSKHIYNEDIFYSNSLAYRMNFSSNDSTLFYTPYDKDFFYIFKLKKGAEPDLFNNAKLLHVSKSGNRIVFLRQSNRNATVNVYDVKSQKIIYVSTPVSNVNFARVDLLKNDSVLLLERKNEDGSKQLFAGKINNTDIPSMLTLMLDRNVNYVVLNKADQLVFWYTHPKRYQFPSYLYDFSKNSDHKPLNISLESKKFTNSSRHLIVSDSVRHKVYVINLLSGKLDSASTMLGNRLKIDSLIVYESPDLKSYELIYLCKDRVMLTDLVNQDADSNEKKIFRVQSQILSKNEQFSSISLTGKLITIQLVKGGVISYFLDRNKNTLTYLKQNVYPILTQAEEKQYGVTR